MVQVSTSPTSPVRTPTGGGGSSHRWVRRAGSLLLLGGAYVLAGKVGLLLAVGNSSVSAVWPASGLAIAALILGGSELWPAVFAGAFLVNLTTTWDLPSSLGIAAGNTLEALVGSYLARRFASGKFVLDQPKTVLTFALLSGFGASAIAASIGTTSLVLARLAPAASFYGVWGPWWLGDAIGTIEVAPLILAFASRIPSPSPVARPPTLLEVVGSGAISLGLGLLVFARAPTTTLGGYPLIFLVLPPIIWAAFRFGPRGAVLSVSAVSVIAIVATITGSGPFATLPSATSLLALRIFIGSLVLTALLVASDVSRHRGLEADLYSARKELQRMLNERTVQLDAARSLANIGSWTYDVTSRKLIWSDEMYRILGYGEDRFPVVLGRALERVHPEDRETFVAEFQAALKASEGATQGLSESKYRIELPSGEERTVLSRLQVSGFEGGHVTRITGTVQDISEREHLEQELRRHRTVEEPVSASEQDFLLWMIPWMPRRRR